MQEKVSPPIVVAMIVLFSPEWNIWAGAEMAGPKTMLSTDAINLP